MPDGGEGKQRLILDANVLAAGLTSRREPASYSRRLVELSFDGEFDLVVTEILLEEVYAVLIEPKFVGSVGEEDAAALVAGLATVATVLVRDRGLMPKRRTDDPDDDFLAEAALQTGAYVVTRDEAANFGKINGLESGRPGAALRRLGAFDEDEQEPPLRAE